MKTILKTLLIIPIALIAQSVIAQSDLLAYSDHRAGEPTLLTSNSTSVIVNIIDKAKAKNYNLNTGSTLVEGYNYGESMTVGIDTRGEANTLYIIDKEQKYSRAELLNEETNKTVIKKKLTTADDAVDIKLVPPGSYYLILSHDNGDVYSEKIIIL